MRARIVVASLVLLASAAGAQERSEREVLNSAREALRAVRVAVASSDWVAINRAVEVPERWKIESLVKDTATHQMAYSFWRMESRVAVDSLHMRIENDGAVRVTGDVIAHGRRGSWEAVLDNVNGRWKFRETHESWGRQ